MALDMIEPVVVAAYVEKLLKDGLSKPTVEQHLAGDPNAVRLDGDRRDSGDESGFGSTRPQIRHRKRKASKPKCRCLTCFDSSNSRPRDPKYLKTFCLGMSIRYQTTNASAAAWRVRARAAPNLRRSASEEIPDQHYIPMRLRDWFAPVTVIALEACIFP